MADTLNIFDNGIANLSSQRTITSGFAPQTFKNAGTDTSYSLDGTDTQDYFRLRLTRSSSVILSLTDLSGNANIELLDGSGNSFIDSQNPGALAEAIVSQPLAAGDYYIRVFTSDNTVSTNYTLNVNTVGTDQTNILWRNYSTGQNVVWLMDGITPVTAATVPTASDTNWRLETVGDFDGDRSPDYVWRNYSTGQISFWIMDGNVYRTYAVMPQVVLDPFWRIEGAWDMNNDGQTDLVWRDYNPNNSAQDGSLGRLAIWYMNGTSLNTSINPYQIFSGANDVRWELSGVNDFNQDGKADFLWRHTTTGENTIWLMNGTTFSANAPLPIQGDVNWKIAGTGDFTGDGRPDLLWRNYGNGQNAIWRMNGTTVVTGVNLAGQGDTSWVIAGALNAPPVVDLAGNSINNAFDIGNLTTTGIYNADQVGNSIDRNDYYKFTLTGSSVFNLSLSGLSGDVNVWLIQDLNNNGVVDGQNELRASSTNSGNADETISNLSLTAGTYFVRIYSPTMLAQATDYSLQIGAIPAQQIDLRLTTPAPSPAPLRLTRTSGAALPTTVSLLTSSTDYVPTVRVFYQVQNSSSANVTAAEFRVKFYLSRDPVISSTDFYLGNINGSTGISDADVVITNLAPNTISSGSRDITLPSASDRWWGGDQTYYIGMIIDADNQIAEINESNNAPSVAIAIKDTVTPDVVGGGLTILPALKSLADGPDADNEPDDRSIRVTGSIRNIGNLATGTTSDVLFYLSTDDFLDVGRDYLLGFTSFGSIGAKSSITFDSNTFTTPLALPTRANWNGWQGNGRYYILMWIDPLSSISESQGGKENNLNAGRLLGQYIDYNFFDVSNFPA